MRNSGVALVNDEWEIRVPVVFGTPVSVGGEHDGRDVDAVVARDGLGRPVIPGTSWAGVLRAWSGSHAWNEESNWKKPDVWGSIDRASAVTVLDSVIHGAHAEIRDGIGIDRPTGTAAQGVKFTREVIAIGSTTDLVIRMRTTKDDALLFGRALVDAINTGVIGVGAMRTRGLGLIEVRANEKVTLRNRSTLSRLACDAREELLELSKDPEKHAAARVELSIRTDGPFMVASGTEGVEHDRLPLVTSVDDEGTVALVLPGSSLKGALRAQAERIWRTLTSPRSKPPAEFLAQLLVDTADGPVSAVFGRAPEGSPTSRGCRGAVAFKDLVSNATISAEQWRNVIGGEGAAEVGGHRVLERPPAPLRSVTRVAIDRWTGGAAKGMLYSTLEPSGSITWRTADFAIDAALMPAGLALLVLVLRDLVDGWVPIGFGANRSGGEIEVLKCVVHAGGISVDVLEGDALPAAWLDAWTQAVGDAIDRAGHERPADADGGLSDGRR